MTILPVFMGSSVYCIFLLINPSSFSPIAGTDNPDSAFSHGEPDCHDGAVDSADTEKTLFVFAMVQILNDDTVPVSKNILRFVKRNTMLQPVSTILAVVPFHIECFHLTNVIQKITLVKSEIGVNCKQLIRKTGDI